MFTNLTNLWRKFRGSRSVAASKRLRVLRKSRRLFLEPLENRSLLSAIITVNSADDTDTRDTVLTLREAIAVNNRTLAVASLTAAEQAQVNGSPTSADTDTINFNIPGSGVHTISPTSALPTISDPVIINGYSQPGASPNTNALDDPDPTKRGLNGTLLIELDGTNVGNGLSITAGNSRVRGLVINRFSGVGILLASSGNVVAGNFIGTNAAGDADLGNGAGGVEIDNNIGPIVDASHNNVGGTLPADRNLISGNNGAGVSILAFDFNNNPNRTITDTKVQGNLIGTDKAGTAAIGNNGGIRLQAGGQITGSLIGGTTAAARNVIAGNTGNANISVSAGGGGSVSGTSIQGNFIGIDVTGTVGLANSTNGVNLSSSSSNNTIGGDDDDDGVLDGIVGAANVISGHPGPGVAIDSGSSGNLIEGNRIGTNAAGTAAIPNGIGVSIGGPGNFVGGAAAGAGNLISGNSGIGVFLQGYSDNIVQGNRIGTDVTGANPLSNSAAGVFTDGSNNNLIGGTGTGEGNVIAFNSRGVNIGTGTGNSILANSIFSNSELGIDLFGFDGVTQNDESAFPFDTDPTSGTAANNFQNFPDLTSAVTNNGTTTITGTLKSTENTSFRIEFFTNDTADPSGFGEGQTFVDAITVTTDASGVATINFTTTTALQTGLSLSATATKLEDTDQNSQTPLVPTDTSEFSADICVADQFTVVNTNDSGPGSLRQAILNANAHNNSLNPGGAPDVITFCIPGSGVHTITPLTQLETIDKDAVVIDGYTQEGAVQNTSATGFNGTLLIEINGASAGGASGLRISAGQSTVRGLVINRFILPSGSTDDTLGSGILLEGSGGNTIEGNFLGTDPTGTLARPNQNAGIFVAAPNNTVGGATPAARNVISGNAPFDGVFVSPANGIGNAAGNLIQGNFIGTQADGVSPLGNARDGVTFAHGAHDNLVGGVAAGAGNRIAFNNVGVFGSDASLGFPDTLRNAFLGNSIFSNASLGIDLNGDGVTANDQSAFPFDTDTGPNNLQNFPDLTSVTSTSGTTTIQGTLKSNASTEFRIEFFASAAADPSGNGEGQVFLGSVTITDGGAGDTDPAAGIIGFSFQTPTPTGTFFTATATRTNGDGGLIETSEFSAAISTAAPENVDLVVSKTDSPDPVVAGTDLTYTISVSNAGTSAAQSVSLSDTIPANTTLVSVTTPAGWTRTDVTAPGGTGTITETTLTLAGGANVTFTLVVHVNSSTAQGTTVTNTANVGTLSDETDTTNNAATATTTVNTQADLSVTKSPSSSVVAAGGNLAYTIIVSNAGPSDAQGVSISDVLPPGTTFVSLAAPAAFTASTPAAGGAGTFTASASTLAAGQSASFTLVVHVDSAATGGTIISNTAQATTMTADTNPANNSASATTQVQQPTPATGLTITLVSRQAKYKNEFGLFVVDDAQGRIGNLLPGDPGYARAAVSRTKIVFSAKTKIGTTANLTLPPGGHFGMYLVQNSTSSKFLRKNPENRLGRGPLMFFSFAAANPDGFNHVRRSGTRYKFEDMTSGGDRDFDDLVIDIRPRSN